MSWFAVTLRVDSPAFQEAYGGERTVLFDSEAAAVAFVDGTLNVWARGNWAHGSRLFESGGVELWWSGPTPGWLTIAEAEGPVK